MNRWWFSTSLFFIFFLPASIDFAIGWLSQPVGEKTQWIDVELRHRSSCLLLVFLTSVFLANSLPCLRSFPWGCGCIEWEGYGHAGEQTCWVSSPSGSEAVPSPAGVSLKYICHQKGNSSWLPMKCDCLSGERAPWVLGPCQDCVGLAVGSILGFEGSLLS